MTGGPQRAPFDGGKWVLLWWVVMLFCYAVLAFGVAAAIHLAP